MTDLSADRPLLLPEEIKSFTEEDVEMLVQVAGARLLAMTGLTEIPASRALMMKHEMRAVLTALAAAGRLLPTSAEHREEWTYRAEINGREQRGEDGAEVFDTREEVVDFITSWSRTYPRMSVADVRYAARTVVEGPWVEEDGSTDE